MDIRVHFDVEILDIKSMRGICVTFERFFKTH